MCGIVGYIGDHQAGPVLVQSLEKLEYRGYDSAGVCTNDGQKLIVEKEKGKIEALSNATNAGKDIAGNVGRHQLPFLNRYGSYSTAFGISL